MVDGVKEYKRVCFVFF